MSGAMTGVMSGRAPVPSEKPPRLAWGALLLLAVGTVVTYRNILHHPFLFDDLLAFVDTTTIKSIFPLEHLLRSAHPEDSLAGRPVLALTLALNYAYGALDPYGYHIVNIGIHFLNAVLLLDFARHTVARVPALRGASNAVGIVAALLWLLHPLQTESVTYTVQRAESLVGLFYLGTLAALARSLVSRWPRVWMGLSVASAVLGMGTKESCVTVPLMVILWDRAFAGGSFAGTWRARWRYYTMLADTWLVLYACQSVRGPIPFAGRITPTGYWAAQAQVVPHYVSLAFWPTSLCLDYGWSPAHFADVVPNLLGIGTVVALVIWATVKRPRLGFPGAWFFGLLAPTSLFPISDAAFEHRMYLPLAGLIVATLLLGRAVLLGAVSARVAGRVSIFAVAIAALALAAGTVHRNRDYQSLVTMWRDTVKKAPKNPRPRRNAATALIEKHIDLEEAMEHFQAVLQVLPPNYNLWDHAGYSNYGLGVLYSWQGNGEMACRHFAEAVRLNPADGIYRQNLANCPRPAP